MCVRVRVCERICLCVGGCGGEGGVLCVCAYVSERESVCVSNQSHHCRRLMNDTCVCVSVSVCVCVCGVGGGGGGGGGLVLCVSLA